jgi:spore protease
MKITRLRVLTDSAAKKLGKPVGSYITCEFRALTDDFTADDERLEVIGSMISELVPKSGCVLVAGIGNHNITPDALGPKAAEKVLATRHFTDAAAKSHGLDSLRPVCVLAPGVLGQTGIEVGELISGVIKKAGVSCVIAVDALASRSLSRLGCTVQISDTGISPGAGIGNRRARLDFETLGVPVIAVGVPTVVDSLTLVSDLLRIDDEKTAEQLKSILSPRGSTMVVTPKEIDLLIDRASRIISLSINKALQSSVDIADIEALM